MLLCVVYCRKKQELLLCILAALKKRRPPINSGRSEEVVVLAISYHLLSSLYNLLTVDLLIRLWGAVITANWN